MGYASIALNILSVVTLPMVLAVAVMTTDSPRTPKSYIRGLYCYLAGYLLVVLGSIGAAWWLRSESRPGTALLVAFSPLGWILFGFALLVVSGFGKDK